MPFISEIMKYASLSVVGLDKNTGKTETLNYILSALKEKKRHVAVTSIGVDGESIDRVTQTVKPDITLYETMLFTTSEQHYATRQLLSEVVAINHQRTALGRLVTARVLRRGETLLSGPADTKTLQEIIRKHASLGADITLVDGALSRLSLASPTVTEALVLTTGAACSASLRTIISKTTFACTLIALPEVENPLKNQLLLLGKGLFSISENDNIHDLNIASSLLFEQHRERLLQHGRTLYVAGVVNDRLLQFLRMQKEGKIRLIVEDFTKLFISQEAYDAFIRRGGIIEVLHKANLIAVTVNPSSPQGYSFPSHIICEALSLSLQSPVYDVRKIRENFDKSKTANTI
ncbi:MAG: hypothetical protein LBS16_06775 [Prevotellaceae bacterium]|jgi:hypothetical protein|nr:hypothetical protein [Prevotellaceae bacterium]